LRKNSVPVVRSEVCILPDARRVISKPFLPGGAPFSDGRHRIERILDRIQALSDEAVRTTLADVVERFAGRHVDFVSVIEQHFALVAHRLPRSNELSEERRHLIGAYFTHEYSIDAAALTNPSLVRAPHQEGVPEGAVRFILSLRAIGEGHLSSIQFRSGQVDAQGRVSVDPPSRFARTAMHRPPTYDRNVFRAKLSELDAYTETAERIIEHLPERFTIEQLEARIVETEQASGADQGALQVLRTIHWLASSNYESTFHGDSQLSERVMFPAGPSESQGMEDARFVRFQYDDGSVTYFAPYTAYDGYRILPQLIETRDFMTFRVSTLNGTAAQNKGIALFPRQIDGSFVALARLDGENNFLIRSKNVRFWYEQQIIQTPRAPWEIIQLGNCGSPIETEAGWLVITHGVGPLRRYCLGAILLDLNDPSRVLGCLEQPLLEPAEDERDGYVPNVLYSCGNMAFGGRLLLPYGFSDVGARIATLAIDDLLGALV
jgi:predicted GH43/DUF377 family glycosyl hydrolase